LSKIQPFLVSLECKISKEATGAIIKDLQNHKKLLDISILHMLRNQLEFRSFLMPRYLEKVEREDRDAVRELEVPSTRRSSRRKGMPRYRQCEVELEDGWRGSWRKEMQLEST
jgi:hypothetical protein